MHTLETVLEERFGLEGFRPGQREVVQAVLAGRDTLAQMPTGAGKSLCYQLPSQLLPHATLVVSPLLALIQDQIQRMRSRGLQGVHEISAHRAPAENLETLEALKRGEARVVFVSPERFSTPGFLEALREVPLSLFVVDEAHCITQWGHDFRPDYLRLGEAVEKLRPRSVLALTATATPSVRGHIVTRLAMRDPFVFLAPLDRPNLHLTAQEAHVQQRDRMLLCHLDRGDALPGVIYVHKRTDASGLAQRLREWGFRAEFYHAGLAPHLRHEAQARFLSGEVPLIVATMAFGMGIDKPDVRSVVHWSPPASLESWFQEAGRAGRDGRPARCLLLWSKGDFQMKRNFAVRRYPPRDELDVLHAALATKAPADLRGLLRTWSPERWKVSLAALLGRGYDPARVPEKRVSAAAAFVYLERLQKAELARVDEMERFAAARSCRRRILLGYFGEQAPGVCGNCDHCGRSVLPRPVLQRPRR